MIKSFDYDLFVIGAGTEGVAAARQAVGYGVRVAISQRNRVGGTCIIHGCISEELIAYATSFSHVFENADE